MFKRIAGWYNFRNSTPPASNPPEGFFLYADSGVAKVRQADGTVITLANAVEIDSVIFDAGDPTTDHTLGDSIIFDAGGPV